MTFSEQIEKILRDSVNDLVLCAASGFEHRASFSDLVAGTKRTLNEIGCKVLESIFSEVERCFDAERDKHRIIIRNRNKSRNIITEFGLIRLNHTLYFDKDSSRYFFAADELLQIEKYSRIEQNLQAKLVADATLTSFGKASSLSDDIVSRQTVYNLTKKLKTIEAPLGKVENNATEIFIEADEDHIHLKNGKSAEMKLVYVHEGRENTNERITLKNPRYFVSIDSDPDTIWNDVSYYLMTNYRTYKSRVHLSGDGAPWIRAGTRIMPNIEYHLDKYHLNRAILNIARGDKKAQKRLRNAIYDGRKEEFFEQSKAVYNGLTNANVKKSIGQSYLYIRDNLDYISRENRCCAEGHVSHVLSARLSSRPMAWSAVGAERMAKLRAYLYNNGDFVQLIKNGKVEIVPEIKPPSIRQYNSPQNYDKDLIYDERSYSLPNLGEIGWEISNKLKKVINN